MQHHPFIRFDLDFHDADAGLWELLGRCASLFDLISVAPLKPTLAEKLYRVSLTKYIQGTTAIEGHEYNTEVVEEAVARSDQLVPDYTPVEIDSFLNVIIEIRDKKKSGEPLNVTPDYLCELNRTVLTGAPISPSINIGHLRYHHVGVHGYRPPESEHLDPLVGDLCYWINDPTASKLGQYGLSTMSQNLFKALFAHLYFEMIHPFGDGNGRVGRLLELDLLARSGVPLPAAMGLTSYYNEHKNAYFAAIQAAEAQHSDGGIFPFINFALRGLYAKSKEMVAMIQSQTLDALWKDYVYEQTDAYKRRAVGRRQQTLALSLDSTPRVNRQIREISTKIAVAYSNKTDAILTRDLKALQKLGLVTRLAEGWKANKEKMQAFLAD
ncbi:MAG: Fic family protein [Planctomycetota bacterium]